MNNKYSYFFHKNNYIEFHETIHEINIVNKFTNVISADPKLISSGRASNLLNLNHIIKLQNKTMYLVLLKRKLPVLILQLYHNSILIRLMLLLQHLTTHNSIQVCLFTQAKRRHSKISCVSLVSYIKIVFIKFLQLKR